LSMSLQVLMTVEYISHLVGPASELWFLFNLHNSISVFIPSL